MNECKIVEDLLPLYAEELVSDESAGFIREHTAHCANCAKLLERAVQPVRELPEDPEALNKALRRNKWKLTAKIVLAVILVYAIAACFFTYMAWENGDFGPEGEFVSEQENAHYQVNVYDWDTAGFFHAGEGSIIRESSSIREEDEDSVGYTRRSGSFSAPWENVRVEWAPNGEDYLFIVELVSGGTGHFLRLNDYWTEEGRGSFGKHEMIPRSYTGSGLSEILTPLCRKHPDLSGDWSEIRFTFLAWSDDSETITFIYETDTGDRGFVDYHYPTETITAVE